MNNQYQHTLQSIFQNPVSTDLKWHDVILFVEHIGTVKFKNNGQLTFTIHDIPGIYHQSSDAEMIDSTQLLDLRHFLESVGIGEDSVIDTAEKLRLLVVISQLETLIFRTDDKNAVPEHLHPHDPHHVLHHANHRLGDDKAARLPENTAYYESIAKMLLSADQILLMGSGTGAGSAMSHLKEYLVTHHHELAERIVGAITVDVSSLTEGEFLKEARAFYQSR